MTLPNPGSTPRTAVHRLPEKASADRAVLNSILDEGLFATVALARDGQPFATPCAYARDGDRILLHGSRASRLFKAVADSEPLCVSVTLLDGLVYARSLFESSMNYRSVTVFGTGTAVAEDELLDTLLLLSEKLMPGRSADARHPHERELAQTMVVEVPLTETSVKIGDKFGEDADDIELPCWSGILPLSMVAGKPVDAPDLGSNRPVPSYVLDYLR